MEQKKAQMPAAKIVCYFSSLIESLVQNHGVILNKKTEQQQQQQALSLAFNEGEWMEEKIKEN